MRRQITHVAGAALKARARSVADAVRRRRDRRERMARWAARIAEQAERLPVPVALPMLPFVVSGIVAPVAVPAFPSVLKAPGSLGGF